MSYTEFKATTEELLEIPMLSYLAVANIQGVEYKDSAFYFVINYLQAGLSSTNINNLYMIVPDDVTVEPTGNQKVIKEYEFGNYIMEYVNSIYGEKVSYKDSFNGNNNDNNNNTNDNNNNSNKPISTSKNNSSSRDNTKKDNSSNNSLNKSNNNTVSKTTLPKTGTCETISLISITFICIILTLAFGIKNIKCKDIK